MKNRNKNIKKHGIRISIILALFILMSGTAVILYSSDYYHALSEADLENVITEDIDVITQGNETMFEAKKSQTGLIFYPGGKVEATAYEPLLKILASKGISCVLIEMPFHLAVLDSDAANKVFDHYPEIKTWYMAGHSLGGAMAASYVAKYPEQIEGLILLAAYPTKELSPDIKVLSVYGDQDQVLTMENYLKNISQVKILSEVVLEGGNHAQFGNYGLQKGDGMAQITPEEQWVLTADAIIQFIEN